MDRNELTWQDIRRIFDIEFCVMDCTEPPRDEEEHYKRVLKLFNELKDTDRQDFLNETNKKTLLSKPSEYEPGTFLYKLGLTGNLSDDKKVFIHNGHLTGDGYGVLLGFTSDEQLCTSSGFGNYCYGGDVRLATQEEIVQFIVQVQNYDKPIKKY